MARVVATTEKQAELLKDQGNKYFKKDRLAAAIEAYTEVGTSSTLTFQKSISLGIAWQGLLSNQSTMMISVAHHGVNMF